MRIFVIIAFVFIVPFIPKLVWSCESIVGEYKCGNNDNEKTLVSLAESNPYSMKQTKLGIALGPLELDGTKRKTLKSGNVEVLYQGQCLSESSLKIELEQIYFGGLKVRFDHELYVENDQLFLKITDYKIGKDPVVRVVPCS
ncbi:MAG: hypothetical protein VX642_12030 [Bdellovibrionota bacterium]|nr:hypothetical protein [Bdellovibrionota bacterium]